MLSSVAFEAACWQRRPPVEHQTSLLAEVPCMPLAKTEKLTGEVRSRCIQVSHCVCGRSVKTPHQLLVVEVVLLFLTPLIVLWRALWKPHLLYAIHMAQKVV